MSQFKKTQLGSQQAKPFNQAPADAAATVDREPGWLVDHPKGIVFIQCGKLGCIPSDAAGYKLCLGVLLEQA
ncbi:MAG: hypothetical protein EBW47_05095 [Betaproteobacteria bacterium]|nr:hypothetical protein [Betaproteobacteria bacterium]